MKKFEVKEESKKKIIAIINALVPEAKIYLYGSRARGANAEWSDIDLALDAGKQLPRLTVGELREIMIATNIPYKVDIVDFHNVHDAMQKAIAKDKVAWKA